MKQKKNIFVQIWYVAYPLLFYYAVALIAMSLCQWLLGSDDEHFVMCQLVSTVITIPFMMPFYRSANYFDFSVVKSSGDQVKKKSSLPEGCIKNIIFSVIIVLCISFALNNLISMTPLVEWSKGYQQANAGTGNSQFGNLYTDFGGNGFPWHFVWKNSWHDGKDSCCIGVCAYFCGTAF